MTLSGIRLVRQVFGEQLPKGWTVAQAFLHYKHEHDAELQVIEFHLIAPGGEERILWSDKVPARDDVNELAVRTARTFLEGLKDAQASPAPDPKPADKPEPGSGN